jgi:hypothetical protein
MICGQRRGADRCLVADDDEEVATERPSSGVAAISGDDGADELEQFGSDLSGEDEVESLTVEAVETNVKLALRRAGGVVFPAWAMELGDALHGDDQLESHRGGSDIQRRSMSGS